MSKQLITLNMNLFVRSGRALSIDPGSILGYALVDVYEERAILHGELAIGMASTVAVLRHVMADAWLLIIEDQYLATGTARNPDTLIKLAAMRGWIEGLWAREKGLSYGENVMRVKPGKWQAALNLSARAGRDKRKAASMVQAKFQARETLSENEADALNMGIAIIKRLKHNHLLKQLA